MATAKKKKPLDSSVAVIRAKRILNLPNGSVKEVLEDIVPIERPEQPLEQSEAVAKEVPKATEELSDTYVGDMGMTRLRFKPGIRVVTGSPDPHAMARMKNVHDLRQVRRGSGICFDEDLCDDHEGFLYFGTDPLWMETNKHYENRLEAAQKRRMDRLGPLSPAKAARAIIEGMGAEITDDE